MRKWSGLAAMCFLAGSALAASAPPPDLMQVRAGLSAALKANDPESIASFIYFPLANVGGFGSSTISRAQFLNAWKKKDYDVFTGVYDKPGNGSQTPGCFFNDPLTPDSRAPAGTSWSFGCNDDIYHFRKKNGHWLLTEVENIGE
jgi:hypothetical protein